MQLLISYFLIIFFSMEVVLKIWLKVPIVCNIFVIIFVVYACEE
jgi:hypothetical protein